MLWMLLAASAPTYLACTLDEKGQTMTVNVVVDEADQQAIIDLSTGYTARRPAVFSPSTVRITDDESTWLINRVTLDFSRQVVLGDKQWTDKGKCKVAPAPAKRAF